MTGRQTSGEDDLRSSAQLDFLSPGERRGSLFPGTWLREHSVPRVQDTPRGSFLLPSAPPLAFFVAMERRRGE